MAQLRDGNACGGQTQHVGRNPNILSAHYNGCRLGVVGFGIVDRSLFSSGYDAKTAVEQILNRVDGAICPCAVKVAPSTLLSSCSTE